MKTYKIFFSFSCAMFSLIMTGCNAGVNLNVAGTQAEGSGIIVDGPTPAPNNSTGAKNRIFVSNATVRAVDSTSPAFYDSVCAREAKRSKVTGKFAALIANSEGEFSRSHVVKGFIYQKFLGVESIVADSYTALISGRNDSIYTTANQLAINTTVSNYVWTGQRNFNQPASTDENCQNWSTSDGEAIVGKAGTTGSDAMAMKMQSCNQFAHLYCIEVE